MRFRFLENKFLAWIKRRKYVLAFSAVAAIFITVGVIILMEANAPSDPVDPVIPPNGTFRMVYRSEWAAHPPVKHPEPLSLPTKMVIIAHTVTHNCFTLVRGNCNYFHKID